MEKFETNINEVLEKQLKAQFDETFKGNVSRLKNLCLYAKIPFTPKNLFDVAEKLYGKLRKVMEEIYNS